MSFLSRIRWGLILAWAVALGLISTVIADWGEWDRFLLNLVWRMAIVAVGGIVGVVLNIVAGGYVGMGTNVIESMGVIKFSEDANKKIENAFIFTGALLGAIAAIIFIK